MQLTTAEIDLLRTSLRRLALASEQCALTFYDRLFEVAPETRSLFSGDMDKQTVKMMSTLGTIVSQIRDHDTLRPLLRDLAVRHVGYGVLPEHYGHIGETLFWTLGQQLGAEFTAETETAWRRAFDQLAARMIDAAYDPSSEAKT